MDKRQKILDHIVEAQNWYAEANRKMQEAKDYLDELYFEHVDDGELDQTAISADRIKVQVERFISENVRNLPDELGYVIRGARERFWGNGS